MKLKSGRLTFYRNGVWIGPSEMKEHTYYETLKVFNGIVETNHPISVQWLINRGYQIVQEDQETNREPTKVSISNIQEEKEEVKPMLTQFREEWKKSPGRPRKY